MSPGSRPLRCGSALEVPFSSMSSSFSHLTGSSPPSPLFDLPVTGVEPVSWSCNAEDSMPATSCLPASLEREGQIVQHAKRAEKDRMRAAHLLLHESRSSKSVCARTADAVHGDGDGLVRLARDGAQGHAARAEAAHDVRCRLHLQHHRTCDENGLVRVSVRPRLVPSSNAAGISQATRCVGSCFGGMRQGKCRPQ